MMRRANQMAAPPSQQPPPHQQPAAATPTPVVDMSHLTEEERLMIQSVMAKAEMADMGIPVDTSGPNATNLPSTASLMLAEQAKQQQKLTSMAPHSASSSGGSGQQQPGSQMSRQVGAGQHQSQVQQQQQPAQVQHQGQAAPQQQLFQQPPVSQQQMMKTNSPQQPQQQMGLMHQQQLQQQQQQPAQSYQAQMMNQPSQLGQTQQPQYQQQPNQPNQQNLLNQQTQLNQIQQQQPQFMQQQQQQQSQMNQMMQPQQQQMMMQQMQPQQQMQVNTSNQPNRGARSRQLPQQPPAAATHLYNSQVPADRSLQSSSEFLHELAASRPESGCSGPINWNQQQRLMNQNLQQQQLQQQTGSSQGLMQIPSAGSIQQHPLESPSCLSVGESDFRFDQSSNLPRMANQQNVLNPQLQYQQHQVSAAQHSLAASGDDHLILNSYQRHQQPTSTTNSTPFAGPTFKIDKKLDRNQNSFAGQVESAASDTNPSGSASEDASDKAIKLLSELKLTEKATQVMEQQQLLIKQSQELIKLQLEQQALTHELKRMGRERDEPGDSGNKIAITRVEGVGDVDSERQAQELKRVPSNEESGKTQMRPSNSRPPERHKSVDLKAMKSESLEGDHPIDLLAKSDHREAPDMHVTQESAATRAKKSAQVSSKASRATCTAEDLEESYIEDFTEDTECESREGRKSATQRDKCDRRSPSPTSTKSSSARRRKLVSTNSVQSQTLHEPRSSPQSRFVDDPYDSNSLTGTPRRGQRHQLHQLSQSPTDTTDSDVELMSTSRHSSASRHLRSSSSYQNRTKAPAMGVSPSSGANAPKHQAASRQNQKTPTVRRAREPIGLPPSPLPVAAAIQLHQMQQQHFKSLRANQPSSRVNQALRSRSVTSSPNHQLMDHLGHNQTGYLTERQRAIRSVSPDTLSEFGGQRRRKRLPEPPTNLMPLTPSMVRKMIQAQRAAAASSVSTKLPTSVNAQSTHLTNKLMMIGAPGSDGHQPANKHLASSLLNDSPAAWAEPATSQTAAATSGSGKSSDLGKFLSSTYGESILRNSNISDIKETPELDKLISNLDEIYGLESRTQTQRQQPTLARPAAISSVAHTYNSTLSSILSPTRAPATGATSTSRYGTYSQRDPQVPVGGRRYPLMRYNSEGENNPNPRLMSADHLGATRSILRTSSPIERADLAMRSSQYPSYRSVGFPAGVKTSAYSPSQQPTSSHLAARPQSPCLHTQSHPSPSHATNLDRHQSSTHAYQPDRTNSLGQHQSRYQQHSMLDHSQVPSYRPSSLQTRGDVSSLGFSDYFGQGRHFEEAPATRGNSSGLMGDAHHPRGYLEPYRASNSPMGRTPYSINAEPDRPKAPLLGHNSRGYQYGSLDLDSRSGRMDASPMFRARDSPSRYNSTTLSGMYTGSQSHTPPIRASGYPGDSAPLGASDSPRFSAHQNEHHVNNEASRYNHLPESSRSFAPLTKDDIIRNGPKFNSIGYRFGTEIQNKYVTQANSMTPIPSLQSRYPHPYRRILLSKNPKDRLGNGIGVQIVGGHPLPNVYDRVNRSIVSSGAFVTEVFQTSNVCLVGEMREGDQIIEWNGVNLCNRSNEEVQQILLSQFSDDEVEIVYLNQESFNEAYNLAPKEHAARHNLQQLEQQPLDAFDAFANMNRAQQDRARGFGEQQQVPKSGSIRRKLSLSSLTHMWSR